MHTEGRKLCDDLVDDLLELTILDGGLGELWRKSEEKLGVCLGEMHVGFRSTGANSRARLMASVSSHSLPLVAASAFPLGRRRRLQPPGLPSTAMSYLRLAHTSRAMASYTTRQVRYSSSRVPVSESKLASPYLRSALLSSVDSPPPQPPQLPGDLSDQEWEIRTGTSFAVCFRSSRDL